MSTAGGYDEATKFKSKGIPEITLLGESMEKISVSDWAKRLAGKYETMNRHNMRMIFFKTDAFSQEVSIEK